MTRPRHPSASRAQGRSAVLSGAVAAARRAPHDAACAAVVVAPRDPAMNLYPVGRWKVRGVDHPATAEGKAVKIVPKP